MKRLLIAIFSVLLLLGTLITAMPANAAAPCSAGADPLACVCGVKGASSSTACGNNGSNPISGTGGVLYKVTILIASVAGAVAVIIMLVAGIMFVTAGGNAQKVEQARNAIIGSVVGLVIIAVTSLIIVFVVSRL